MELGVVAKLFADIIIVFIFRAVIQLLRSRGAKHWPSIEAEVMTVEESSGGCLSVELTYKYRMAGELYTGTHTEPFLWVHSVNTYLEPRRVIIVRIKPGQPEFSVVRDRDLYSCAHGYRLES
ncbi:MAG TPA: hypothetical protein VMS18_29565 [Candidatus Binatia bacterium]|nr:hypothetical protein [Candidatus Binatia bacterium]